MPSQHTKPDQPKAVEDCHALLAWIIPKLDQFPRQRRFTLGERIETGLLQVLEQLIHCSQALRGNAPLSRSAAIQPDKSKWAVAVTSSPNPIDRTS